MAKSTRKPRQRKPSKDFPLWLHPSGRWCKKVRGRAHYFGKADDPQAALDRWLEVKDDLLAGRTPRAPVDGLTVRDLVNTFLTSKGVLKDDGEIVPRTFDKHKEICGRIVEYFGRARAVSDIGPRDFEGFRSKLAQTLSPLTLRVTITNIRSVFRFAHDKDLVDSPVRFGQGFRLPSKRLILQARQKAGPKMFEAAEVRTLLQESDPTMGAFILLGVNCAFGPADIGQLPTTAIDLSNGWIDFPRLKSGVGRHIPLWKETAAAIHAAQEVRPAPKDRAHNHLAFITIKGNPWGNDGSNNAVTSQFRKLLKAVGTYRSGLGFYGLRHSFETVAGESIDQVAVDHIMGHTRNEMAAHYGERISDERLTNVVNVVRDWLFSDDGAK